MEVRADFGVDAQDIGAGVNVELEIGLRRFDHEMYVERALRDGLNRFHDRRADC